MKAINYAMTLDLDSDSDSDTDSISNCIRSSVVTTMTWYAMAMQHTNQPTL